MNQVEQDISRIAKHNEQSKKLLDKLLADYHEREKHLADQVKHLKEKIKGVRLPKAEAERYARLQAHFLEAAPLNVLDRLLTIRVDATGYKVLSSDGRTWYEIPIDLRYCPCQRFNIHHDKCAHLKAAGLVSEILRRSTLVILSVK